MKHVNFFWACLISSSHGLRTQISSDGVNPVAKGWKLPTAVDTAFTSQPIAFGGNRSNWPLRANAGQAVTSLARILLARAPQLAFDPSIVRCSSPMRDGLHFRSSEYSHKHNMPAISMSDESVEETKQGSASAMGVPDKRGRAGLLVDRRSSIRLAATAMLSSSFIGSFCSPTAVRAEIGTALSLATLMDIRAAVDDIDVFLTKDLVLGNRSAEQEAVPSSTGSTAYAMIQKLLKGNPDQRIALVAKVGAEAKVLSNEQRQRVEEYGREARRELKGVLDLEKSPDIKGLSTDLLGNERRTMLPELVFFTHVSLVRAKRAVDAAFLSFREEERAQAVQFIAKTYGEDLKNLLPGPVPGMPGFNEALQRETDITYAIKALPKAPPAFFKYDLQADLDYQLQQRLGTTELLRQLEKDYGRSIGR